MSIAIFILSVSTMMLLALQVLTMMITNDKSEVISFFTFCSLTALCTLGTIQG